jgi:hypothetical protein
MSEDTANNHRSVDTPTELNTNVNDFSPVKTDIG